MKNEYTINNGVITLICKHKGKRIPVLLDEWNLDKISQFGTSWCIMRDANGRMYAVTYVADPSLGKLKSGRTRRKCIRMHRLVTGCPEGLEPDHIDKNSLNNCEDNLRVDTHQNNMYNQCKRRDNSSGVLGVSKCSVTGKWKAQQSVQGYTHNLGLYDCKYMAGRRVSAFRVEHGILVDRKAIKLG